MVLAADIGNSNVVIGCFENNDIKFVERLSTNRNSTALEYAVLIKTVLELNGCSHILINKVCYNEKSNFVYNINSTML